MKSFMLFGSGRGKASAKKVKVAKKSGLKGRAAESAAFGGRSAKAAKGTKVPTLKIAKKFK